MATPFYLRGGTGKFNYVNHKLQTDTFNYAGNDNEIPGYNTAIHTRREWKKLFPEQVKFGEFERVTGKRARQWRKQYVRA